MIRLEAALIETRRQLHDIQQRVGEALGSESAGIFEAHLHVVDDPSFIDEVYREVREKRKNIEKILFEVSERYAQTLLQMEDDYLRERAADIQDVTRRILRNLAGGGRDLLAGLESPRVLVSRDIAPSEMAAFDRRKILGVVTELGSPTSHAAIMARAMDLPAIVGLRGRVRQAGGWRPGHPRRRARHPGGASRPRRGRRTTAGSPAAGRSSRSGWRRSRTRRPSRSTGMRWRWRPTSRCRRTWRRSGRAARAGSGCSAANISFMTSGGDPSEERQYKAYAEVARRILPESAIIRTLDLGGDKLPATVKMPEESNPFLGWRAIRLCLDRPAHVQNAVAGHPARLGAQSEAAHHVSDDQQRQPKWTGPTPCWRNARPNWPPPAWPSIRPSKWA